MPPTERRTRFGVEVGLANPGGLAGEIRREATEGQRQANAATTRAQASHQAASAEDRRLRALQLQNQALREQSRLYRRALGLPLERRASPGVVEARARVLGREVRSEPLDAAARALFVEQGRLTAALQAQREQYRREAAEMVAAQRAMQARREQYRREARQVTAAERGVSGVLDSLGRPQRFIRRGLDGVFNLPAFAQKQGEAGVAAFFAEMARQRLSYQRHLGRGQRQFFNLPAFAQRQGELGVSGFFDSLADHHARRNRQLQAGFGNLFGGAAAPIDRVARSMGLGYEDLADRVSKSGKSLTEFIRLKTGATAAEARNEKQLKGLTTATSQFDQTNRRSNTGLGETGRVLRSLLVAFVGFQVLRGIQNGLRSLIDYQKQLQSVRLGVAEILLIGNRFRDQVTGAILPMGQQIQQSFALATRASRELVEQSIKFGLPLDTLVGTFQTVGGLAASAGVSLRDTLDIITQIGVVAQRLNIPFNQLTRSADNIFTGLRVQQTQLGVILGLNQSIVQQQIRQGTLGQFLLDRLRGVGETLPENLKTMEGITQSLRSLGLDFFERITGGGFQAVQDALSGIRDEFDQLRQSPNTIKEMRDQVTQFTKDLIAGAEAAKRWVEENRTIVNLLVGGYVGNRLIRGPAGIAIGGAAATGWIDPGTALQIGLPLALIGHERQKALIKALIRGKAEGLTGAAGVASRLSAAFPAAANFAGGFPAAARSAIGGAVTALSRFAGPLAIAAVAVKAFSVAIDAARTQAGRVNPITGGGTRDDPYALRFRPGVGGGTAEEQRLRLRDLGIAGLAELQRAVGTPEARDALQRNLGLIENAGFNNRSSFLKAGAEGQLKRARELVGPNSPILAFLNDLQGFGDKAELEKFTAQFERLSGFVVGIEPTSLVDSMLKAVDGAVKKQRKIAEEQSRELDVIRARNNLAEQAVAARQEIRRVEQRALEEQERSLRVGLDLALSQQNLAFAQTTGQRRSGLQARITQIQARIATTQQGIGLAEGAGEYTLVEALQRQLDALQQSLQRAQVGIADTEVAAARQALDQAGQKLGVEENIVKYVLPERLRLERELLDLQRQQAAIRAAGASQELEFAQRILEGAQGIGRLIAKHKADALARQDPNFNKSTFAKQELEASIEENRARIQVARSQADLKAAQAQIAVTDRELQIAGIAATNERGEAERRIAESRLEQVTAGQELQQTEANRAAIIEQENQLYLEQLQRWRQINEEQNQFIGNSKQFLSDILQRQKFSTSLKNFAANITRNLADGLSNATINFLQDKAGGSNGGLKDFLSAIGNVFRSGTASSRGPTANDIQQAVQLGSAMRAGSRVAAGASNGGFTAGYGFSSLLGGTSAFAGGAGGAAGASASAARLSSGAGFIGAGAGGSAAGVAASGAGGGGLLGGLAGAAGAGGGAVTLAAIAAIAGTQGYLDGMRRAAKGPRATPDTIARGGREKAFQEAGNIIPIVGPLLAKGMTAATSFIKVRNRGDAAASGAATGAAIGSVVPILGTAVGAILGAILGASTFGAPTAGSLQQRFLAPALANIGLAKNVRFAPGDLRVYSAFRGANGPRSLPASYGALRGAFSGFGQAGKQSSRGQIAANAFGGLDEAIAASVLGAAADLNLAAPDAFGLGRDITKTLTKDFRSGSFNLLAQRRRGRIAQEELISGLGGMAIAYNDLTLAIDGATLAQAAFTREGSVSLKQLENAANMAKTVIDQGLPKALTEAISARSPIRAAQSLAESFGAAFVDQLGRALLESGGVQKALTEAVALSTRAADAFAAGDLVLGNQLLAQSRQAFLTGRNDFLRRTNMLYGPTAGFLNSIGIYGEGGLINPTGAGLPSFDTTSTRHVAGPTGAPSLSILHGGEVIRAGAHDDAIAKAVNNLAAAQAELAAAWREGRGGGADDSIAFVQLGDDIIERATVRRVRRGAVRGMRTPSGGAGVSG